MTRACAGGYRQLCGGEFFQDAAVQFHSSWRATRNLESPNLSAGVLDLSDRRVSGERVIDDLAERGSNQPERFCQSIHLRAAARVTALFVELRGHQVASIDGGVCGY